MRRFDGFVTVMSVGLEGQGAELDLTLLRRRRATGTSACWGCEPPSRRGAIGRSGAGGSVEAFGQTRARTSKPSAAPFHRKPPARARPGAPRRRGSSGCVGNFETKPLETCRKFRPRLCLRAGKCISSLVKPLIPGTNALQRRVRSRLAPSAPLSMAEKLCRAVVRVKGLEPPRPFGQQILSLPRLPFRHTRIAPDRPG
jgi:hypothetical protein